MGLLTAEIRVAIDTGSPKRCGVQILIGGVLLLHGLNRSPIGALFVADELSNVVMGNISTEEGGETFGDGGGFCG